MKGDLYINGKDAWTNWGINMGEGFLDAIDGFVPMKDVIENESRKQDGKRVIMTERKVASREITLRFTIRADSESDFRTKRVAFEAELQKGWANVVVPKLGDQIYKLIYLGKNVNYGMNRTRTLCSISAKFEEPNPADRAAES